jgi:hypothetical protein
MHGGSLPNFQTSNFSTFELFMKNQFATLSPEDKNFVIKLCDEHGYEKAADILYEERPEGLCLITSRSALQRFYASHHPDTAETLQCAQYAHALQIRHQAGDGAFIEGMLALVQNKILKSLKNDRPLSEMTDDFRIFKTIHKAFLEEDSRRRLHPRELKTAYNSYVREQASDPDCDFIRADLENDPGAEGIDPKKFSDNMTDEQIDICVAKARFAAEEERREAAMLAREAEAVGPVPAPGVGTRVSQTTPTNQIIILPTPNVAAMFAEPFPVAPANPASLPIPTGNIPNFPPKVPVIPHFPLKTPPLPTSPGGPVNGLLSESHQGDHKFSRFGDGLERGTTTPKRNGNA